MHPLVPALLIEPPLPPFPQRQGWSSKHSLLSFPAPSTRRSLPPQENNRGDVLPCTRARPVHPMQANSPVFVPAAHRSSPFVSPAPIEYVSPPVLYNPSPQSNTGPKGSRLGVRRPLTVPSSSAPGLLGGGGAQRRSKRDGADGGKDVREEKGRPDVGESKKMTSVAALDLMRYVAVFFSPWRLTKGEEGCLALHLGTPSLALFRLVRQN